MSFKLVICVLVMVFKGSLGQGDTLPGYKGCYEGSIDNIMPNAKTPTTITTPGPQECIKHCMREGEGAKYAGLQSGNTCFCGNVFIGNSTQTETTSCISVYHTALVFSIDFPSPGTGSHYWTGQSLMVIEYVHTRSTTDAEYYAKWWPLTAFKTSTLSTKTDVYIPTNSNMCLSFIYLIYNPQESQGGSLQVVKTVKNKNNEEDTTDVLWSKSEETMLNNKYVLNSTEIKLDEGQYKLSFALTEENYKMEVIFDDIKIAKCRDCTKGYSGRVCQDHECDDGNNHCSNGGTCEKTFFRRFYCKCPDGYTGKSCEKPCPQDKPIAEEDCVGYKHNPKNGCKRFCCPKINCPKDCQIEEKGGCKSCKEDCKTE